MSSNGAVVINSGIKASLATAATVYGITAVHEVGHALGDALQGRPIGTISMLSRQWKTPVYISKTVPTCLTLLMGGMTAGVVALIMASAMSKDQTWAPVWKAVAAAEIVYGFAESRGVPYDHPAVQVGSSLLIAGIALWLFWQYANMQAGARVLSRP